VRVSYIQLLSRPFDETIATRGSRSTGNFRPHGTHKRRRSPPPSEHAVRCGNTWREVTHSRQLSLLATCNASKQWKTHGRLPLNVARIHPSVTPHQSVTSDRYPWPPIDSTGDKTQTNGTNHETARSSERVSLGRTTEARHLSDRGSQPIRPRLTERTNRGGQPDLVLCAEVRFPPLHVRPCEENKGADDE
jgi:hypothetical protein